MTTAFGPITLGRDYNFFKKITVINNIFSADCDVVITFSVDCLSILNEGTGVIEVSFNGSTVHAELNPNTNTSNINIRSSGISKIWLRLKSGAASTVRIQSNSEVATAITSPITISGSVTANNSSVGLDDIAAPADSTKLGGLDSSNNLRALKVFDLDTGAGIDYNLGISLRLPAGGGSVVGGTTANPIKIDPTGTTTQPISVASLPLPTGAALDATLLTIDTDIKATQPRDVTDRAARLLGIVYGSQNQQLKQTPTNFNLQSEIAVGGTLIDPRSIRALTSSDVITVNAGSGTFTVSGTVTSNIGTTNGLALDATLIGGTQTTRITDGTNTATVKAASTAAVSTDKALVVTLSPNNSVVSNADGYTTTSAPAYTNNTFSPLSLTTVGNLRVDGSSVTQPVSGTVTSNIGTTNGLALDTSVAKLNISQGSALGTNTQAMVGGSVSSASPTYTDGYINPLSLTTSGALRVYNSNTATAQSVAFADGAGLDSFGRLRISSPHTLFDCKQLIDNQPLIFDDQQTSGSGTSSTFLTNQSSSKLSVSNLTAGTRVRQTFTRFNYQPGKSFLVTETGVLGAGASGITRRIGYFDQNNGVFFQISGTIKSVVVRTSTSGAPVDNVIPQSTWNLDKLDGTGVSGITFDSSKTQIFMIDFQWLGVGRIRFGLNINGKTIYVHEIDNSNVLSVVYMSVPNLPIRYEISNNGTGPAADLIHICSSVIVEGGRESTGIVLSADRGSTPLVTLNDSNIYPLISIRLKSIAQMASLSPISFCVVCTSNTIYRASLLLNPTIVGTALTYTPITGSVTDISNTSTNATTVTGGTLIQSFYVDVNASSSPQVTLNDIPSDLRIGSTIAGVSDILVLAIQRITGTTETFYASMIWREQN